MRNGRSPNYAASFAKQFDSTVVAHASGADQGDPHAQPQVVKQVAEGDTRQVEINRPGRKSRAQTGRQSL